MTKQSPLAVVVVLIMVSALVSVKPVASSCYESWYGSSRPLSHKELQWESQKSLAVFAVEEHNKALSGAQRLKLISIDEGVYYPLSPSTDFTSMNITASNSSGQAKYWIFVTHSIAYDHLDLKCFEKI
ncbi:unnamed protein product [Linum trigynum]|uniref:Cysteine proteinase inhibitor n=2 Tax=Linum trigynum TaxID=586398 RepID=A0AAV2ECW9_9ROSI